MDAFDRLPDSLLLQIFNAVSDVKTLIRCRSLCRRFNSLVPETSSLLLRIDRVISSESEADSESLLLSFIKSLLGLLFPTPAAGPRQSTQTSPAHILSRFRSIRELRIELPSGDLSLEKGTTVRWRAEFGETLRTCVILGLRAPTESLDLAEGLKTRVLWTISALIAASARHFLLHQVVLDHEEMERLMLEDREGEGIVVMGAEGLKGWRSRAGQVSESGEMGRTVVPCVTMRMRQDTRIGATLVVVRAVEEGGRRRDGDGDAEDANLAMEAFGQGVYGEMVMELVKRQSYMLEMNSF